MKNLLSAVSLVQIASALAASATIDNASSIIDMAEFEGALFIVPIDDSVAGATATLSLEQSDQNSAGTMAALVGAEASLSCVVDDDINGKFLVVDIHRPAGRYLRVKRTSATANIAFGAVTVIRYGARVLPVSEGAGMTVVSSPALA